MEVIGIGLAGGRGERARPLSVKAPGYLRSKAAMTFLGRRLVRWILEILSDQGISDYFIVAHGKENRYQIKMLVDHGEPLGVKLRYSRVRFDAQNTGSADSTIRSAEYWDLHGTALVFPTDSIVEMDVADMVAAHAKSGAAVTIGAMVREPMAVAGKYGVMLTQTDGRILEFVEKPSLSEIHEAFPSPVEEDFDKMPLLTNSGFYLVDLDALREIGQHADVVAMADDRLDFGLDLLPWLVDKGYPVYAHPIGRIGDLGNIQDYVETMIDALWGRFGAVSKLLGPATDKDVWIDPESLHMRDHDSGLTLAEKMEQRIVTIGPAVRIGKYSEIFPGAHISESNIDDGVEVHPNARISRSQIRDGAMIGSAATIVDSYVGSMAEIRSTHANPTRVEGFVGIGDEVVLQPGVSLADGVTLYPRVRVPAGAAIPPGTEIGSAEDVMRYL